MKSVFTTTDGQVMVTIRDPVLQMEKPDARTFLSRYDRLNLLVSTEYSTFKSPLWSLEEVKF